MPNQHLPSYPMPEGNCRVIHVMPTLVRKTLESPEHSSSDPTKHCTCSPFASLLFTINVSLLLFRFQLFLHFHTTTMPPFFFFFFSYNYKQHYCYFISKGKHKSKQEQNQKNKQYYLLLGQIALILIKFSAFELVLYASLNLSFPVHLLLTDCATCQPSFHCSTGYLISATIKGLVGST